MGHTCCGPEAWDCRQQHQNPRQEGRLHGVSCVCNQQAECSSEALSGLAWSRLLVPPSILQHNSSPFLPSPCCLSKSTGAQRAQQSLMCLVSTFLSHHHSLRTLCENEELQHPDIKTFDKPRVRQLRPWVTVPSCVSGFYRVGDAVLVPLRINLDLCFPRKVLLIPTWPHRQRWSKI